MCAILPAVRHRLSVVHWRGFLVARGGAVFVQLQTGR